MAAIMKLLKILTRQVMETRVWYMNSIGTIYNLKYIEDEVYFLDASGEVVVATYGDLGNQGREVSVHSKIETLLERVLERVTSTDLRVRELKCDLLDLTQIVESHDVSIKKFEERVNQLASQMELGLKVDARVPSVEMLPQILDVVKVVETE
ncbi:hypothetical protein HAX54_044803 [Datura stramonium]|uniref:Uncharacterized protein n=1 Tax=Datura stramonium TaxID=4076 RepID=A0ABS8SQ45_DATST|nr:hypothetical protein [Datura stramonium]